MRIYISGNIGNNTCNNKQFKRAEHWQKLHNNTVINPTEILDVLPNHLAENERMQIRFKLIDLCDCIYMLKGWQTDKAAKTELAYGKSIGKKIKYEDKQWKFREIGDTEVEIF